jgi:hypothetical protein
MNKKEHFRLIWQTYDFTMAKIVMLEQDYQYLFSQINNKLETEKKLPAPLKEAFLENARDLQLIYNKQLKTLQEIINFCDDNNAWGDYDIIPEEFVVSKDSLKELIKVTLHLEGVLKDSVENVESLLDF